MEEGLQRTMGALFVYIQRMLNSTPIYLSIPMLEHSMASLVALDMPNGCSVYQMRPTSLAQVQ